MKAVRLVCALVFATLVLARTAEAQRATQLAPDETTILVNKRLGQQQWAIVVHLDDQTAIGNVFNLDGSDPQFIWCEIVEPFVGAQEDFIDETIELECFAALGCSVLPCNPDDWQLAGTHSIPGSFFLP